MGPRQRERQNDSDEREDHTLIITTNDAIALTPSVAQHRDSELTVLPSLQSPYGMDTLANSNRLCLPPRISKTI